MVIEMPVEIERKFLVVSDGWRREVSRSCRMVQGYLSDSGVTVRIRLAEGAGMLTVKGRPAGITRDEFEYPIPVAEARAMLKEFCGTRIVEKIRYLVPAGKSIPETTLFFRRRCSADGFNMNMNAVLPQKAYYREASDRPH